MSVERSHRGLVQRFAKPPWGQLHRGFESLPLRQNAHRAPVAQWIEHQLAELRVVGSSPAGRAITWTILPTPGVAPGSFRVRDRPPCPAHAPKRTRARPPTVLLSPHERHRPHLLVAEGSPGPPRVRG